MRPKCQKQSALKLAGRIIPSAKRLGKTNEVNNLKVTIGLKRKSNYPAKRRVSYPWLERLDLRSEYCTIFEPERKIMNIINDATDYFSQETRHSYDFLAIYGILFVSEARNYY